MSLSAWSDKINYNEIKIKALSDKMSLDKLIMDMIRWCFSLPGRLSDQTQSSVCQSLNSRAFSQAVWEPEIKETNSQRESTQIV